MFSFYQEPCNSIGINYQLSLGKQGFKSFLPDYWIIKKKKLSMLCIRLFIVSFLCSWWVYLFSTLNLNSLSTRYLGFFAFISPICIGHNLFRWWENWGKEKEDYNLDYRFCVVLGFENFKKSFIRIITQLSAQIWKRYYYFDKWKYEMFDKMHNRRHQVSIFYLKRKRKKDIRLLAVGLTSCFKVLMPLLMVV